MRLIHGTSRIETVIGALVLTGLVLIAIAILFKQKHYDPQVVRPTLVVEGAKEGDERRGGPVVGGTASVGTSPEASIGNYGAADSVASVTPDQGASKTAGDAILATLGSLDGIQPLTAVEQFDAVTLSDKIDGRAEFYLELGFEILETRRYEIRHPAPKQCEAFVFRMTSPLAAFAAWSNQRRPDARPETTLPYAYTTANALYLVKGRYYVELVSPWGEFGGSPFARNLARELYDKIKDGSDQGDVLAALPAEGRVPGSERLILKDAFGFSKLDNVVLADYHVDHTTITVWISPRQTEAEAQELAKAYHRFLTDELGAEDASSRLGSHNNLLAVDALGDIEVIAFCNTRLLGIRGIKPASVLKTVSLVESVCQQDKKTSHSEILLGTSSHNRDVKVGGR